MILCLEPYQTISFIITFAFYPVYGMSEEEVEILEDSGFDAEYLIEEGEKVSEGNGKDVYRKDGRVVKVHEEVRTEKLKRLGTYLPQLFVPDTVARTEDLTGVGDYEGFHTVVFQDGFEAEFLEELEDSGEGEELGDLVYLLDRMVEEDVVMTDPVLENFNYFDGELKPSDVCDIESVKKFPHSFEEGNEVSGFREEVQHMYQDAMVSVEYETDFSMHETAEIFRETSKYVEDVEITEGVYIDEKPEVEVFDEML